MKKTAILTLLIAISYLFTAFPDCIQAAAPPADQNLKVILAYHPDYVTTTPHILPAYESVLQEEGVAVEKMNITKLPAAPTIDFIHQHPAAILPDGVLQYIPEEAAAWLKQYTAMGGNIAVIYDAGVKTKTGAFLNQAALADIIGLNYITYNENNANAYTYGHVRFTSEANRDFFQIPFGKTTDRLTVSSYNYGELKYPIASNKLLKDLPENEIYAYGITADQQKFPLIVLHDYVKGKIMYVDLPLGYLKGYGDDLLLRSTLRTFLFNVTEIPHVMNVEQGRPGLVINWHVDSDIEHISLPYLLKHGYLHKEIACSYHVTAGNFFLKPSDSEGFDADHDGKRLVMILKDYGTIGSHGGWAHNWFSDNVNSGKFKEKEIYDTIKRNNDCLEKLVGYKITEYAAPNGVHPQPVATKVLERLGMVAYYYTGDTGSFPNRVFYNGEMVSDKVVAFPLMPFGRQASIWEMHVLGKRSVSDMEEWFSSTLDYIVHNRTVRMIYSHPYDTQNYPVTIKNFLDKVVQMKESNEIMVRPMGDYARFFLRFLKTEYNFTSKNNQLVVTLKNPESLDGITIALPKKLYQQPDTNETLTLQEDERYYYVTVVGKNDNEKIITANLK